MKKEQPVSEKFLITIPFWSGDKSQAGQLAKLLADLEPKHSDRADILLVNRFDTPGLGPEAIKYISRKFNVLQHRSARKETGWPSGCNGLFFGMLEYVYHMLEAGKIPRYRAIFNMASDVVPLRKDWLAYLHDEWTALQKSKHPVKFAGAFIENSKDHINGDAAFLSSDLDFLRWLIKDVGGIKVRAGWDWILAGDFRSRGWANVEGIRSLWQTPTMTKPEAENWLKQKVYMIHGVKDDSLLRHAREMLL